MSAKWRRRKKDSKRFSIFKAFSRVKGKTPPQMMQIRNPKTGRDKYPRRRKIPQIYGEREMREPAPLIDILEEKSEIVVVAEFAGFNRENLRVRVREQRLVLSAETSGRRYYKSLNLPKRVIPNAIYTTYKNGVLEIHLKKAVEEKAIDNVAG